MSIKIQHFFDPATSTLTYVVHDPQTRDSVVIDPVWDYEPASGKLSTKSMEPVLHYLKENNLSPKWVLETHAHADHLSSSQLFKNFFPDIKVAIGERITEVQKTFKTILNLDPEFDTSGKAFDLLLKEGQIFEVGSLKFKVLFTPGHTPACASYLIEDALFSGDAIFMPDSGTGRCDFPAGSAETLYESITKNIYTLPDNIRIFVGHDYQPEGRSLKFETTVKEEKEQNIQLKATTTKSEYIEFRKRRDATLAAPKLLFPSIQVNINAGHLPPPEANGVSYLKSPLRQ
ncbi:MBL fold metallo-hydrolase [Bdellovibrio svalbardensis]|uniref:MBL fold metallo-hydrolase n=1 Tax=Bdellovibrio svalbardensis TaxID=2972972 RepID=A0ABT6DLK8_9BACT|nr:MBL fold metallo-hydrolase [Bdellovibrio svalbardensis]MDG0817766.1 MBL fold metallo-hydrolase [Bdellovibrio svalbardensis]